MRNSAKFLQYRFQVFDHRIVHVAAAGNNSIVILQISGIVTHGQTEKIGQLAARFLEYYLRSARVPKFCAGAGVYIKVARLIDDESHL